MQTIFPGSGSVTKPSFDVVIVGAGLAGTLAAILLGRSGYKVALIDYRNVYPPDFRAEQLVGYQAEVLSRLGLLDSLVGNIVPAERAVATRAGRILGLVQVPHYGTTYDRMVNRARQHLPPGVQFIRGQVVDIKLAADRQRVGLADNEQVEGRLVVVATGLGERLLHQIGVVKQTIRAAHSIALGFNVRVDNAAMFRSSLLVAQGTPLTSRIDYLTLFSNQTDLRGNLFTYHDRRDPWIKQFKEQPCEMLRQALPGFEQITGRLRAIDSIEMRIIQLTSTADVRRHGLVLIGDAFQTSCPAVGTGISRLLNDIDRLCTVYVPAWLATAGMDAKKVAQFYDDPIKQHADAEALRMAEYRRALSLETNFTWRVHRHRVELQHQLGSWLARHGYDAIQTGLRRFGTGWGMAPTTLDKFTPAPVRH